MLLLMFSCCVFEGSEILDQMLQCLEHLPKPMPQLEVTQFTKCEVRRLWLQVSAGPVIVGVCLFPQDYLDMVGLSAMFPRVEVFLIQGSPVDMLERPHMDGKRSICLWWRRLILKCISTLEGTLCMHLERKAKATSFLIKKKQAFLSKNAVLFFLTS